MAAASTESQVAAARQAAHLDGSQIGLLRMVFIMSGYEILLSLPCSLVANEKSLDLSFPIRFGNNYYCDSPPPYFD